MIVSDKEKTKPVLQHLGLTVYLNPDWGNPRIPHELYIFDGDELLYKYWFKTGQGRYFIDGYTYPGAKQEIDECIKMVQDMLAK